MGDSKNWRDIKEKSWAESLSLVLLALVIALVVYPLILKWSLGLMGIYVPYKAMVGLIIFLKAVSKMVGGFIQ